MRVKRRNRPDGPRIPRARLDSDPDYRSDRPGSQPSAARSTGRSGCTAAQASPARPSGRRWRSPGGPRGGRGRGRRRGRGGSRRPGPCRRSRSGRSGRSRRRRTSRPGRRPRASGTRNGSANIAVLGIVNGATPRAISWSGAWIVDPLGPAVLAPAAGLAGAAHQLAERLAPARGVQRDEPELAGPDPVGDGPGPVVGEVGVAEPAPPDQDVGGVERLRRRARRRGRSAGPARRRGPGRRRRWSPRAPSMSSG